MSEPTTRLAASTGHVHTRGDAWPAGAHTAWLLAWVSLAWMTVEGAVGLLAGYRAGSSALIGWAFGSVIEGLASIIVIWRFTGTRTHSQTAERHARRAVAISFWLLAPYIAVHAGFDLAGAHRPDASLLGIAVTAVSLVGMPVLGAVKHRLADRLDSEALAGEGTQNWLCAAQAAAVLLALAVTAATPAGRWIDPAVALLLAGWALKEGVEAWQGEDCC